MKQVVVGQVAQLARLVQAVGWVAAVVLQVVDILLAQEQAAVVWLVEGWFVAWAHQAGRIAVESTGRRFGHIPFVLANTARARAVFRPGENKIGLGCVPGFRSFVGAIQGVGSTWFFLV